MKKKLFTIPQIEAIEIKFKDVITTSGDVKFGWTADGDNEEDAGNLGLL